MQGHGLGRRRAALRCAGWGRLQARRGCADTVQLLLQASPGAAAAQTTAALPAVLQRSEAEAALLVARLPEPERRRLHTAALCLHRAEIRSQVWLPQPLVWRILAACLS
ncbi:ankyrin repeat PH and SEC7 domain containing [Chlorella sorokiniana]|uniref:Ankyrin repeat PH and SEC7 domain containing n=1 Tax=Chlorella sorokiniana TaxID=3076 RepID=A0A2P6TG94_CHLSO|nr:ankyrin repeat PH and SEC7 domain containing [Chlorella sorokiniana]|eukprot:PRW33130.1 ankyrin repeat PH and SEC7 domain containing [Chlorella sorokiniana]